MKLRADAVFEGGGVKGIGLVGAVAEIKKAGYEFMNLAGTSAGAIVASLLAAGYRGTEIRGILETLNYNRFKDEGLLDKLGLMGKGLSLGFEYGIYEGEFFENWLDGLLKAKKKTVFGDMLMPGFKEGKDPEKYKYKLQVRRHGHYRPATAGAAGGPEVPGIRSRSIQHLTGGADEHEHPPVFRTGETAG